MTVQKFWDSLDAITVAQTYQGMLGRAPTEGQMDGLLAFVEGQQNYYASQGLNYVLGGYEAMGLALATSATGTGSDFEFRHAQAGSAGTTVQDVIFVEGAYFDIYDAPIPTAVRDHYLAQLNSFTALYTGVYPDPVLMAHGAVWGQMEGYAYLSNATGGDHYAAAIAFYNDASNADGSTVPFGQNLETAYGIV